MSDTDNQNLRFEALEALIDSIEKGPDAGLDQLRQRDDPESIQQRLNILLEADRIQEAADVVHSRDQTNDGAENAIWPLSRNGEFAITPAYCFVGRKAGLEALQTAMLSSIRSRYTCCSCGFGRGESISEGWSSLGGTEAGFVGRAPAIASIITVAKANGAAETALETRATLVAFEINRRLGSFDEFHQCAQLILKNEERQIPLDFAIAVLKYGIPVPEDFPDRVRRDHPNTFDAGLLAAMIEAQILHDASRAFDSAYKLHDKAVVREDREQLFKLLAELAQTAGKDAVERVDQLAPELIEPEAGFFKLYTAAKYLREERLEAAAKIIDETRNEQNPEWLQMCADLELKRGKNQLATDWMIKAAELLPRPELLAQAAQMAYRDGRVGQAAELLEQLLELNPRDVKARNFLSGLLFELKRFTEAARHLEVLRKLEPSSVHS